MPEGVLGRDEIIDCLDAVAALLAEQRIPQGVLIVVGGAYLALHGLREATADVDTVTKINASIRATVELLRRNVASDRIGSTMTPPRTSRLVSPSTCATGSTSTRIFLCLGRLQTSCS
jgi:hypothetical protein